MKFIIWLIASSLIFIAMMSLLMIVNAPTLMAVLITICYICAIAVLCAEKKNKYKL
jgi:hypothetical protein